MKKITLNLFAILFLIFTTPIIAQAPANDDCSGALVLTVGVPDICDNTLVSLDNASDSGLADGGCASGGSVDLWYVLTMPASEVIKVETSIASSDRDTAMSAYIGSDCNSLTLIGCNDDIADGVNLFSRLEIFQPQNTTVYIRVWDVEGSTSGTFNLCASEIELAANDDCDTAIPLPTNLTCETTTGSNEATDSTNNTDFGSCAGSYGGADVWFSVIVPSTGHFSVETSEDDGSITDTGMAIYSGSCPDGLTFIECSDDEGSGLFSFIELSNQTPAEKLYVRVWSYANSEKGTFNICAVELPTLEVEDVFVDTFKIFPNPATNIVNLKFNQSLGNEIEINVFSIQGKVVLNTTKQLQNNSSQLDISFLKSGLYFLKINTGEHELTKKLIIK